MTRILVTGGTGQVGTELAALAGEFGFGVDLPTRSEMNLSDPGSVHAYVLGSRPDAVINAAAYTAVDKAEDDYLEAFKVNALAPAALAQATRRLGIPLLHVSTDYVFDGSKPGDYREDDPVCPISAYGASKLAGEQAVRMGNQRHVILRTAWVFSPHGANFVKTMLRLADRQEVSVVDDQHGCPTAAHDIANALLVIAESLLRDEKPHAGTYHFVNEGRSSWYAFAKEIFRQLEARNLAIPKLTAIETKDYPTPARRPANSVLCVERLRADFGIEPRPWTEALQETLSALVDN